MRTPYKMKGYTYTGESPAKTVNLSKLAGKIKGSKFGGTKLGTAIGNLAEKGGKVQKKFVDWKKDKRLSPSGYDKTLPEEELATRNKVSTSSEVDTPPQASTPSTPEAGVDLEKIKVGPLEDGSGLKKRVTRRTYAKRKKRK